MCLKKMLNTKKFLYLITVLLILSSCNSLSEVNKVLRNEKVKTTDEFLVKKREPLTLPPDYKELPEPGTIQKNKKKENDKIKKIFKIEKENNTNSKSTKSVEKSILDKITK
jgi:hypothetical protein